MAIPTEQPQNFHEWLYQERRRHNMTLQEVADKIERSKSYVHSMETGKSHSKYGHAAKPSEAIVDKLAEVFGVENTMPRLLLGYAPRRYSADTPVIIADPQAIKLSLIGNEASISETLDYILNRADAYENAAKVLRRSAAEIKELIAA